MRTGRRRHSVSPAAATAIAIGAITAGGICVGLLAVAISVLEQGDQCASPASSGQIVLGPPGTGQRVGATEYGGPGDPSSGTVGASGVSLLQHPDSYAELGGETFQTATAMGGLPYLTPLRITWARRSTIAYKRDFGHGGSPVDGLPRVIDLWWQLAVTLGIPYEGGRWAGSVRVERPPQTGAGNVLGQSAGDGATLTPAPPATDDPATCAPAPLTGVPLVHGERARLLSNGLAAAPEQAPAAVQAMVAAGNQIVGKPYLYGGGHGLPLSEVAPAYDCSSSVEHLLYGGGLEPASFEADSAALEAFGRPGPGRWVTLYANPSHVFMYVAGLRWDTGDAAGPGDGSGGIGWHPLVRSAAGFVARHPAGL
jgi:cell wall-associated NlpC family hydrolase